MVIPFVLTEVLVNMHLFSIRFQVQLFKMDDVFHHHRLTTDSRILYSQEKTSRRGTASTANANLRKVPRILQYLVREDLHRKNLHVS